MKPRLLTVLILAALAPATFAQTPAPRAEPTPRATPAPRPDADAMAAARAELGVARRELERASSRLAELTQKLYRDDIAQALRQPAFERPVLGIVMSADDAGDGVRLAAVTPGSPAAEAGLRGGDRLLRINGVTLAAAEGEPRLAQARGAIGELEVDEPVRVAYVRDGRTQEVTLKAASMPGVVFWRGEDLSPEALRMQLRPLLDAELGKLGTLAMPMPCGDDGDDCLAPIAEAFRWRGLRLAELEPKLGRYFGRDRGVLVLTTPGDELEGIEPGDVIVTIDGSDVERPQQAMRLMRGKAPGSDIVVQLLRDRKLQRITLDAPRIARFPLLPPPPPAPPAPPAPPSPPSPASPPSPPAPMAPAAVAPPPPPPPPAAPAPPPPPDEDRVGILEQVLLH